MQIIKKSLNLPKQLIDDIEKFQRENYMTTFTAALIELIRRGLSK